MKLSELLKVIWINQFITIIDHTDEVNILFKGSNKLYCNLSSRINDFNVIGVSSIISNQIVIDIIEEME